MAKGLARRVLGAAMVGTGAGILERAKRQREDQLNALERRWRREDMQFQRDTSLMAADRADERADQALISVYDPETGRNVYRRRGEAEGMEPGRTTKREPLKKVVIDGKQVWVPASQAAGLEAGGQGGRHGKPVKLGEQVDEHGNVTYLYGSEEEALAAGREGRGREASEAARADAEAEADRLGADFFDDVVGFFTGEDSDETQLGTGKERFIEMLQQRILDNPSASPATLSEQLQAEMKQGGGRTPYRGATPPQGFPDAKRQPDGTWTAMDEEGNERLIVE